MTRFFQFALILTACIGGYFLFNEIRLNRNLKAEYSRLTAVHGDLDIKDPSHFYVVACPDNTRRHFRWRMFVPKLQSGFGQIQCELGSLLHGTYRAEPSEQVNEIEFEIRLSDYRHLLRYTVGTGSDWGNYYFTLGQREFMREHWDQLDFKVLGEGQQAQVAKSEPVRLFSVSVPPELMDQIPPEIKESQEEHGVYPIFELMVGEANVIKSAEPTAALPRTTESK